MKSNICTLIITTLLIISCTQENLLEEMKKNVPIYKGARILNTNSIPKDKMSIIQFEIEAAQASEEKILDFYKNTMTEKGWEFKELKQWPGNGSVLSMTKKDWATLSIQTIIRQIKNTGKIKVVLNLTGM